MTSFPPPVCYGCDVGLDAPGALLLSPPTEPPLLNKMSKRAEMDATDWIRKRHLCGGCYLIVLDVLENHCVQSA